MEIEEMKKQRHENMANKLKQEINKILSITTVEIIEEKLIDDYLNGAYQSEIKIFNKGGDTIINTMSGLEYGVYLNKIKEYIKIFCRYKDLINDIEMVAGKRVNELQQRPIIMCLTYQC